MIIWTPEGVEVVSHESKTENKALNKTNLHHALRRIVRQFEDTEDYLESVRRGFGL